MKKCLFPILMITLSFFLPKEALAQCDFCIGGKSLVELRQKKPFANLSLTGSLSIMAFSSHIPQSMLHSSTAESIMSAPSKLPKSWCYDDLAFFCRMEVKLENAVKFPVKFRLGDVQYVDRLEGKY